MKIDINNGSVQSTSFSLWTRRIN